MHSEFHERRLSTAGRLLTDRDIRQGMARSNVAVVFAMLFATAGGVPLALLMERLNASGTLVGLLSTVSLAAGLFQIVSSVLTERLPARKPMWFWNSLIHRALWLAVPLLLVLSTTVTPALRPHLPIVLIVTIGISSFFASLGTAPWMSWMTDLIPDSLRGRFWGFRNAFIYSSMLAAIFLYGLILDFFPRGRLTVGDFLGFIVVFTIAAVAGITDILIHSRVPEPMPRRETGHVSLLTILRAPWRNHEYRRVIRAVSAWNFAIFLAAPFSVIFLKEAFSVRYTDIAYTTMAAGVGGILGAFVSRLLVDRVGPRTLASVCILLYGVIVLVWYFMRPVTVRWTLPLVGSLTLPQPILLLILVNIPAGLFSSVTAACQTTLLTARVPEEHRTVSIALYQGMLSLAGAAAAFVGGWLLDAWRAFLPAEGLALPVPGLGRFTYFHVLITLQNLITWLIVVPLHLRIREAEPGVSFRHIVLGLFTANPLRMVSNMLSLQALQSSSEPDRRARAIRQLGEARIEIAVADLIALLEDPDAEVREESALALGRIGTPPAVDALLARLEDPQTDLGPEILKGLRKAGDRRAVPALIQHLHKGTPEIREEAARTLGVLGDARAAEPLLEVLYGAEEERVAAAAAEALARLGILDAIFRAIPRLREARSRVVKQTLACAIADLLGKRGEFYRLLTHERLAHGEAVGHLMDRLRTEIRTLRGEPFASAQEDLLSRVDRTEHAWLMRDYAISFREAADLAHRLGALKHRLPPAGDRMAMAETLLWTERRFGLALWYLSLMLDERPPDDLETLLALYLLGQWEPSLPADNSAHTRLRKWMEPPHEPSAPAPRQGP